ncbi:hydroxyacid dehydrogenase [Pseudolabrys sp. Root1462]|uniref:FAD-binding oxidoreductase n=1 Tax=Pseudolabrys sp. Root1462 TaxID=1736466 RepID=UPI00070282F6|nr:FAD-binding oxidoreductase [Pseudolabrys sp. Root1462]KQZ01797.1 hydroxyacid dehydrogenase [Pseudolabrys sp. Root1462]
MNSPLRHSPAPEILTRFAAIVGDKYAVTDPNDLASHLIEGRGLYHGRTAMMLRPGSTAEVAAILKLANETRTAIVPQGGNTGLVGGQIPFDGELILSLARLDKIRDVDVQSNTMTCEAGVVLQKAQEAAAAADRLFPLSLGSEGSCTIGGNLSSNAGGTGALAYGVARELMVGVEVVLADGRIMNLLRKLKKDNTGYDLRHLFVGAEGTLGVITAAVLKLFPRPRALETAFLAVPSPEAAVKLLNLAQSQISGTLTGFELMIRGIIDFAIKHGHNVRDPLASPHPWYVLMEVSSQQAEGLRDNLEEFLGNAIEQELVSDATIAANIDQAKSFWHMRHTLTEVQKPEGGSIKHDVSVPVAAIPAFLAEAADAVIKLIPGSRPVPFGHLGDGNIHYNISQPAGADKETFLARWDEVNSVVDGIVLKYGGSISAEHGIGKLKRDKLPKVKDPVALALMRDIKRVLDPNGILNPGKVL